MKIVLAEPLVIEPEQLEAFAAPLRQAGHEWVAYEDKPQNEADWNRRIVGAQVVMMANTPLPAAVVEKSEALRYLNVAFTGLNHIPLALCKEKGIRVTNAAGYSDQAVAELVIGMAINLLRKVKPADAAMAHGAAAADFLGGELAGRTVGIIGTGHIGMRVAELFHAFGARLLGYSRTEKPECTALGMEYVSLAELLQQSDIVTLHVPQNETTLGMIGKEEFSQMKKTALFINIARGPIVDAKALSEALKQGEIAGAGVDVFEKEPPLVDDPLLHAPHVLLTPHVGYYTKEAMARRAAIVFANTQSYLDRVNTLRGCSYRPFQG